MRFIADAMLGRLAKRLRLLGVNVLYDPAADDNDILRQALAGGRTILTRATRLASRPLARGCILIHSDRIEEQLEQFLAICPVSNALLPLTRCLVCNGTLVSVARYEVRDLVPDHVFGNTHSFQQCPGCGRVYWQGSHVRRMQLQRDQQ